ncbi:TPA: BREX-1 system adenine-specific DNA-methyltransferase PglX [Klebsiella michiganensis]|nr:BREX-1 system adenine-specific DNA-methyltransferase PglX [Klebsiella michiganensis]HDX9065061.1 BREX-1 system adenine-specific DNA-methyltransferase PglX [Klebsiella michiganensis]
MSQQENNNMEKHFYRASAADFNKIPGSPIAYWVSQNLFNIFKKRQGLVSDLSKSEGKNVTTNNAKFVKFFWEVNCTDIGSFDKNWLPCAMGGDYRKWYGNIIHVIDWSPNARSFYRSAPAGRIIRKEFWTLPGITWGKIGSAAASFRFLSKDEMYQETAILQNTESDSIFLLALLNSKVTNHFLKFLSPTVNFQLEDIYAIPTIEINQLKKITEENITKAINIAKKDWGSSEQTRDFTIFQLLDDRVKDPLLKISFQKLRSQWSTVTLELKKIEEENNLIFINAYNLKEELSTEVPLSEITLICNPHYRYGSNKTEEELDAMLQGDTMAELISYTIGCMMGRYSLDREGVVYAHGNNEGFKTLTEEGAYTSFPADSDGILPLTSEAWFEDDIVTRVEEFVRTVWDAEHLEENLQFIADSLCLAAIKPVKKGGETSRETIRRYLSTQFFKDHLKTYKKRPIYWLFSSGKEKAFECLVYLHRYNETTLPRMRTEYVTPLLGQMDSRIERLRLQQNEAETAEAKRIGKEIDSLTKQLTELRSFDDQLKHYADMKIQLDLDDGVKVNYGKFGTLLAEVKAITGDKAE